MLCLSDPLRGTFKLKGVTFDCELSMAKSPSELLSAARWELRKLLGIRHFYTDADLVLVVLYRLLSYLEYRTPAIYDATRSILRRLDAVQT